MVTASPSGAQVIFDSENPRSLTGVATADILAGMLIVSNAATTAQAVGSTTSTYVTSDVEVLPIADSQHTNGLALQTVSSGTSAAVAFARQGTYILRAAGVVSGGQTITGVSGTSQGVKGAAITITSGTVSTTGTYEKPIGTALTNSASGTNLYLLAGLNI